MRRELRIASALFTWPVVVAGLLLASESAFARPKGQPGTDERKAYCNERYASCIKKGSAGCDDEFPSDPKGYSGCVKGVLGTCGDQFGTGSSCRTEPLVRKSKSVIKTAPLSPKAKLK